MKDDYFRKLLGIQILETKDGFAKMSLKVKKEHINIAGFTHGGVIFSLADCAFSEAVNFGDNKAVAIQVSINYLRPTSEGDLLTAEATTISDSRTLALCSVIVRKEKKDVAVFSGLAYKINNF